MYGDTHMIIMAFLGLLVIREAFIFAMEDMNNGIS